MNPLSRLLPIATLILALFGPLAAVTHAAGGASFSLRPVHYDPAIPATKSYFIFQAEAGQTFENEVRVTNDGDAAGVARIYAVDATTGANSGPVYQGSADPRTDVGAWITIDQQELTLGPGENQIITFKVTVPRDARAGQHLGGLAIENAQAETPNQTGALRVNIVHRMVAAVQVTLPGPTIERVTITDVASTVEAGFQLLKIGFRNEGTEMVQPTGTVQVIDSHGQTVQNLKLQLASILPENEIKYPLAVDRQALAPGDYQAQIAITYGKQGVAQTVAAFTVSKEQITQLYEAQQQALPPAATATVATTAMSYAPWILCGLLLAVVLGMFVFRRK